METLDFIIFQVKMFGVFSSHTNAPPSPFHVLLSCVLFPLILFHGSFLHLSPCLFSASLSFFFFLSLSPYQYLVYPCMGKGVDMPMLISHLSQCVTVLLSHQPWGKFREITVLCTPPQPICHFHSARIPPDDFPIASDSVSLNHTWSGSLLTAPYSDSHWFMLAIKCTRPKQRFGTDGWEEDSNICKYLGPLKPACTLL